MSIQVFSIHISKDIKAMAVIRGDNDQSILEFTNRFEVVDGSLDRVIKLEKLTKGICLSIEAASDMINQPASLSALALVWRTSIALSVISFKPG